MAINSFLKNIIPTKKILKYLQKSFLSKVYKKLKTKYNRDPDGHCIYPNALKRLLQKKHIKASTRFTIITPAYNAERHIEDYLRSIECQSLSFKNNIQLILIDDGSTDNTALIIKKWQEKYPENIEYFYQENKKINRARNAGFAYIKNPWVTFIDADDFVHKDYFRNIDKALSKYFFYGIKMLCCRELNYYEKTNEFKDNRPFNVFFKNDETLKPCSNLDDYLHFSVASAFFSVDEINRQGVRFVEDNDWRVFDDAHFVLRYLADIKDGYALFCRTPIYYYRRRESSDSNIDTSWQRKQFFLDVINDGYIDILEYYKQSRKVIPHFVQTSILYEMSWKIKELLSRPNRIKVLSEAQINIFLNLCDKVFSYIDSDIILSFPFHLNKFNYKLELGVLHCFKKETVSCRYVYIDDMDYKKNEIRCRFYSSQKEGVPFDIFLDQKKLDKPYTKNIEKKFLSRIFIYEHHHWVRLPSEFGDIHAILDNKRIQLDLGGKKFNQLTEMQIRDFFSAKYKKIKFIPSYGPWILMDRDVQADDNAEHLYRYIVQNHPTRSIFFALRRSSPDWIRLEKEGFQLIEFGTPSYLKLLSQSSKLISSHMDQFIVEFSKNILIGKHFICLQHGIIKDDLSRWLNSKRIDLFITTTEAEYQSIAGDCTPYIMGKKEVKKTGLPRHDSLLRLARNHNTLDEQKNLLIMPTWRNYLLGPTKGKTHSRHLLSDFFESEYAQGWLGLLTSEKLKELAKCYGFSVLFFPHFGMQEYFKQIRLDKFIKLVLHKDTSIQSLFAKATILLTDYSSVAFEMAYLYKQILYYQFDRKTFFQGNHVYVNGYFDYEYDGFGPVSTDLNNLLFQLEQSFIRGREVEPMYYERMLATFPQRDENNCERVYKAILALDNN